MINDMGGGGSGGGGGGGGVSAHESSPILIESGPINRHGFPLH